MDAYRFDQDLRKFEIMQSIKMCSRKHFNQKETLDSLNQKTKRNICLFKMPYFCNHFIFFYEFYKYISIELIKHYFTLLF